MRRASLVVVALVLLAAPTFARHGATGREAVRTTVMSPQSSGGVALDNRVAIIGAYYGGTQQGAAYVFDP